MLLRDCSFDMREFEDLTAHLCDKFHHVGARYATRRSEGDGFTTGVSSKNFILFGHSEGHYRPSLFLPDVCFFMCVVPPNVTGGETTLVDGVELLNLLPTSLCRKLEDQGVIYEFLWEPVRWQAEFGVTEEAELKAFFTRFPSARYTLSGGMLHMFYSAACHCTGARRLSCIRQRHSGPSSRDRQSTLCGIACPCQTVQPRLFRRRRVDPKRRDQHPH